MDKALDVVQAIADGVYDVYTSLYGFVEKHTVSVVTILVVVVFFQMLFARFRRK